MRLAMSSPRCHSGHDTRVQKAMANIASISLAKQSAPASASYSITYPAWVFLQPCASALLALSTCAVNFFHLSAVTACMALANIVKSSLGPVGLDKMLVSCLLKAV